MTDHYDHYGYPTDDPSRSATRDGDPAELFQRSSERAMSSDIHSDGSVELFQRWFPGGARGNRGQQFIDGEQYLMAVFTADEEWEFSTVTARCGTAPVLFEAPGGTIWDWIWSDVEWFVPVADLDLPTRQEEPASTDTATDCTPAMEAERQP